MTTTVSEARERAIDLLSQGYTPKHAAERAGVSIQWVRRQQVKRVSLAERIETLRAQLGR